MICAPALTAAFMTLVRLVSIETKYPKAESWLTTDLTRLISSASVGFEAPGRVDSPPTSRIAAPSEESLMP